MCPHAEEIEHGYTYTDDPYGQVTCGDSVTYRCSWWTYMEGYDIVSCTKEGTYDHPLPQCVINSKQLPLMLNKISESSHPV